MSGVKFVASEDTVWNLLRHDPQGIIAPYTTIPAYLDGNIHSALDPDSEEEKLKAALEKVMARWQPKSFKVAANSGEVERGLMLLSIYRPASGWQRCIEILESLDSMRSEVRHQVMDPLAIAIHHYFPSPPAEKDTLPAYAQLVRFLASTFDYDRRDTKTRVAAVALLIWIGAAQEDRSVKSGSTVHMRLEEMPSVMEISTKIEEWASGADLDRCRAVINRWIEQSTNPKQEKADPITHAKAMLKSRIAP